MARLRLAPLLAPLLAPVLAPLWAPLRIRFAAVCSLAAGAAALSAGGCSSPSRAPESDVIEVERIDLTAPEPSAEDSLVLPGAAAPNPSPPTETVPAPASK